MWRAVDLHKSADAAIAMGDICTHSDARLRYYRLATQLDPANAEALAHLALQAAQHGLREEARERCRAALRIGFAGDVEIADMLAEDVWCAARIIGDDILARCAEVQVSNLKQAEESLAQDLRFMRRRRPPPERHAPAPGPSKAQ